MALQNSGNYFLLLVAIATLSACWVQFRGGFNGRPLVQWPTGPQASDVIGAPGIG